MNISRILPLTKHLGISLSPRARLAGVGLATGALLASTAAFAGEESRLLSRNRVEHARYTVLKQDESLELRRHDARVVASVHVKGPRNRASRDGFKILAAYIFGNNEGERDIAMTSPVDVKSGPAEIAMTAPVDTRERDGGHWIRFTMPSKYSLSTLPKPVDPRIHIDGLPESHSVAQRVSGRPDEHELAAAHARLRAWAKELGYTNLADEYTLARFDPPWTPPFMRRTEISLEVRR